MKWRYFNYAVILAVLVTSALLSRLLPRPSQPSLQADLKLSLDRFWNNSQTQVAVTGAGDVQVRVSTPPGTRQRQQWWSLPLARWVATRHPEARLGSLTVIDARSQRPIIEYDGSSVNFAERPYFEMARSQLLQRQAQRQLDTQLGEGKTLALVDAITREGAASWLPNVPNCTAESTTKYGYLDLPGENGYVPAFKVFRIEARVLVQHESEKEKALVTVALILGLNKSRGDRLKAIVLAAP